MLDSALKSKGPHALKPARIFIDGEAGTTGLQIRDRLAQGNGIELISIEAAKRKDAAAKRDVLAQADITILCLPDAAARESITLIDAMGKDGPRVIDASTAHRTAPGWVFGFPEMAPGQADAIRMARRVANPGCYSTGAIALIRPLVDAKLIPPDHPITINAVSGYSGGGKSMIAEHEAGVAPSFELYGLSFEHKHLPEIIAHSGLTRRPIFVPSVGDFRQGMLVSVPLHLDMLPGRPSAADLKTALVAYYGEGGNVRVVASDPPNTFSRLEAESLNGTDLLEIRVAGSRKHPVAALIAKLDNLGKGASGAAVQSMDLMLGRT
jgi:N-acetyl-gamma-glutamyl-phosphate reductase